MHEHYVNVFFFFICIVSYEALLEDGSGHLCVLYPNCTSAVIFCINPDMFLIWACDNTGNVVKIFELTTLKTVSEPTCFVTTMV